MMYNWVRLSGEEQDKASEETERFLNMIQNPAKRIYYAEKFQNYDVAMNVSVNGMSTLLFIFLSLSTSKDNCICSSRSNTIRKFTKTYANRSSIV